jgi:hypothetical protein
VRSEFGASGTREAVVWGNSVEWASEKPKGAASFGDSDTDDDGDGERTRPRATGGVVASDASKTNDDSNAVAVGGAAVVGPAVVAATPPAVAVDDDRRIETRVVVVNKGVGGKMGWTLERSPEVLTPPLTERVR